MARSGCVLRREPRGLETAFWERRDGYDAGEDARVYWKNIGRRLDLPFGDETIDGLIEREIQFWSRFDDRVLVGSEICARRVCARASSPIVRGRLARRSKVCRVLWDILTRLRSPTNWAW